MQVKSQSDLKLKHKNGRYAKIVKLLMLVIEEKLDWAEWYK